MTEVTSIGRPPDAGLTEKILDETLRQLQTDAYATLRIEHVAAAVGCGKTAVYRRWENKAALAAAALKHSSQLGELPDTGNIVDDLVVHAWRNVQNQRARGFGTDKAHNIWASITDPAVRQYFWDEFLVDRRRMGTQILRRAMDRGDLPENTDTDLILDALAGLTIYRNTVRLAEIDDGEVRALATALVHSPPLTHPSKVGNRQ
ncbi:TetR/AcrR family transcriptional regulator [Spelaeicoccus albus]|uniref:AcrR family transcriptional regulator n=1 Tax=Spelaeicoccus albus TaxID=1280376 RepID=A0A7Z0A9A4_9MICO|nr:TetR/AcrR family transcriptional regulator [Spelaeicoccus albus]NYI66764.1 AcrR family transcriptional regulator [Spelaeicoccus albus]